MVKVNILFLGHNLQLLFHTPKSYLDYQYREGAGWAYYEINRVFDTGLMDHLYPRDIYGIDFKILKKELTDARRQELKNMSYASIPKERRRGSALQTEYTPAMNEQDIWVLDQHFKAVKFNPKIILCVGENVLPAAVALSERYHAQLAIWQKEIHEVQPTIPKGIKPSEVLILDDVAGQMRTVRSLHDVMPEAKVAFLVDKRPKKTVEKNSEGFFFARRAAKNVWVQFPMTQHPWNIS